MFRQKRDPAPDKPTIEPADAVQQARTRARQRLIGAIVLLAIGVIGFPLVFESQPRPIPVDIPIEIPRRDALPPLAMPPPRPAATRSPASEPAAAVAAPTSSAATTPRASPSPARSSDGVITESSSDAGRDVTAPRSTARASAPADAPRRAASAAVAVATTPGAPRADDGERARALLEGRAASAAGEQRFVVQVGAFADAEAARETRRKIEKLGLKTYTQVAQTSEGSRTRVRVGPFSSRGDAEAALAKAKAAGMNAVLLTL